MECPKCEITLADSATYCGCGWRKTKNETKSKPFVFMPCAHMACNNHAITRIKTKTGWADFCTQHYSSYFLDRSEEKCFELGLDTTQQKRDWVLEKIQNLANKWRPDYLDHDPKDAAKKAFFT